MRLEEDRAEKGSRQEVREEGSGGKGRVMKRFFVLVPRLASLFLVDAARWILQMSRGMRENSTRVAGWQQCERRTDASTRRRTTTQQRNRRGKEEKRRSEEKGGRG